MNHQTTSLLKLLSALIFSTYCTLALAIPKAAEDENAPVTTGADVAKPSPSKKQAKPNSVEKSKKTTKNKNHKAAKTGKPATKTKAPRRKK